MPRPHTGARTSATAACLAACLAAGALLAGLLAGPLAGGPAAAAALRGTQTGPTSDPVTYTTVVTDPDDTAGPLDVARVSHRVTTQGRHDARLRLQVRTFRGFDAGRLHPHRRTLVVELDTDGERGAELNLRISARHGEPVAELISNATRKVVRRLPVSRPDSRTVVVTAGRDLLGARRYFWTATYHRSGSAACGTGDGYPVWCQDTVPERGWIRMDRPAWPDS